EGAWGTGLAVMRVLFECVEITGRSQFAESFIRVHGAGAIEPYIAGSKPSGQVNPRAIASMRELGYDLSRHVSKSLSDIPAVEYDVAVTMGCGDACPNVRAKQREEWNTPDPKALPPEEFRKVRDQIEQKVRELLARLA